MRHYTEEDAQNKKNALVKSMENIIATEDELIKRPRIFKGFRRGKENI